MLIKLSGFIAIANKCSSAKKKASFTNFTAKYLRQDFRLLTCIAIHDYLNGAVGF